MRRSSRSPMGATCALLLAACRGVHGSPSAVDNSKCEADEADLMQRNLRTAIEGDQGPFRGPGSAAHAALFPAMIPNMTNVGPLTESVEFDCQGHFYRIRFEGGYGRGQWCLDDHGDEGMFTKAEAETALKYDALNRLGLEIGPLDWYGYMRPNQRYRMRYGDGLGKNRRVDALVLEDLGPCGNAEECPPWENQAPTEGEKLNGFNFPPYEDVPEAEAPRCQFNGTWCNFTQINKATFPQCNGIATNSKASVFGSGGLLYIHTTDPNLTIPHVVDVDTMSKTLPLYGAKLVPHGEVLPTPTLNVTLLSYAFAPSFEDVWVYSEGGPGIFLEHHLFAHYFMNPTEDINPGQNGTQAATIALARQVDPSKDCQANPCDYWITAFSVPSGYTIFCPPGCIHEDWTNRGKEVTSLADWKEHEIVKDNTVYLRNDKQEKIRLKFELLPPPQKNVMTVGKDSHWDRGEVRVNDVGSVEYDKPDCTGKAVKAPRALAAGPEEVA